MKTGLINSDSFEKHNTGDGHPEKIEKSNCHKRKIKKLNKKNLIWEKPKIYLKIYCYDTFKKLYR